ncbi:MAG TPA: PEP-CTERM sorting domain-containing protein [Verrucomicrobiae bacterium]|nr:PEP-CTERM sorting domain-containing protein [Verrucomicrobiae bacterium]
MPIPFIKPFRSNPRAGNTPSEFLAGVSCRSALILATTLAGARADTLFTSEFYQGNIAEINTANGSVSIFASGLSNPEGLAFDKSGNLFVAMQSSGVIDRISPSGTVTPIVSGLNYYLSGLTIDSAGDIYVGANVYAGTFSADILKFSPSGALLSTWSWPVGGGPLQPTGLAFDGNGNLLVTDYSGNALYSVSPTGVASELTSEGVNPLGLAFDAQGNLFIANRSSGTIAERTPEGTLSTFATGVNDPAGLAFDSAGNLYVANSPNGGTGTTITEITPNGTQSIFATGLNEPLFITDVVPEPGTCGLLALGIGSLAISSRTRKAITV